MAGYCVTCKKDNIKLFMSMFCPNKQKDIGMCEDCM